MQSTGSANVPIGIFLPVGGKGMMGGADPRWSDIQRMAQEAEAIGLDFVGVLDHLLFHHWECWTMLGALAASTERIQLMSYVTCTGYRNPGLLAKMAITMDEISNGRLILGVGAGDSETEHRAFGFPQDRLVSRFEEALQVIRPMLQGQAVDHEGEFYKIQVDGLEPYGWRSYGPQVLIGSLGGPRMLRLTAEYADIWDGTFPATGHTLEGMRAAMERVDAACERAGRDPATLQRMMEACVEFPDGNTAAWYDMQPVKGEPEQMAEQLNEIIDLGIDYLQLWIEPNSLAGIEQFAPVLEILRRR